MHNRKIKSQKTPQSTGQKSVDRVINDIYSEINKIINSVNTPYFSNEAHTKDGKPGDIRIVEDKSFSAASASPAYLPLISRFNIAPHKMFACLIVSVDVITSLALFRLTSKARSLYRLDSILASFCLVDESLFKKQSLTFSANCLSSLLLGESISIVSTTVGVCIGDLNQLKSGLNIPINKSTPATHSMI